MLKLRPTYLLLFIFSTWLALATRSHHQWFHHFIVKYGGDIIWSGMFVFFLRFFFVHTALWKLALLNYILGVLDECSQLSDAGLMVAIRNTYLGRLLFGVGFLWSDLLCYATGTLIACGISLIVDRLKPPTPHEKYYKIASLQTK